MTNAPDPERQAFLRSFGFSKRDILRIQQLAEETTDTFVPPALDDLDVPYRIATCLPDHETRHSGQLLGHWAGRALLYWRIPEGRGLDAWARRRRAR